MEHTQKKKTCPASRDERLKRAKVWTYTLLFFSQTLHLQAFFFKEKCVFNSAHLIP